MQLFQAALVPRKRSKDLKRIQQLFSVRGIMSTKRSTRFGSNGGKFKFSMDKLFCTWEWPFRKFLCVVEVLGKEMRCATSTSNSEPGWNSKMFCIIDHKFFQKYVILSNFREQFSSTLCEEQGSQTHSSFYFTVYY